MSPPQENGIIRFDNLISLKHIKTGRFLTSRGGDNYETGSGQQKTFTVRSYPGNESFPGYDRTWIVLPPQVTEEEVGCKEPSPISEQQEVSCYGDDENSDKNDIWIVEQYGDDDGRYEDEFWHAGIPVIIRHAETGQLLHSHDIALSNRENEVTCFDYNDDNCPWIASFL